MVTYLPGGQSLFMCRNLYRIYAISRVTLGCPESDGGSDLADVRTGSDVGWLINGAEVFITGAKNLSAVSCSLGLTDLLKQLGNHVVVPGRVSRLDTFNPVRSWRQHRFLNATDQRSSANIAIDATISRSGLKN